MVIEFKMFLAKKCRMKKEPSVYINFIKTITGMKINKKKRTDRLPKDLFTMKTSIRKKIYFFMNGQKVKITNNNYKKRKGLFDSFIRKHKNDIKVI